MKAIALFLTVGVFLGYGLADVSQPVSAQSPIFAAQDHTAAQSFGR